MLEFRLPRYPGNNRHASKHEAIDLGSLDSVAERRLLRKEVIQPQVPLRLPCYDFTPVTNHTLGGCLPCGLAHRLPVQPTPMV